MSERNSTVIEEWSKANYRIRDLSAVMTPALAIYPELVRANIEYTIELLGGEPDTWRPHVKTAKLGAVIRMLTEHDVKHLKCSTTLELHVACLAGGAKDVLLAHLPVAANAARVQQIALDFPEVRVSAIVEACAQVEAWRGSRVGLFVDINPGMDRTGIEQSKFNEIFALIQRVRQAGVEFRGLHYYDGQLRTPNLPQRIAEAHLGYDRLCDVVKQLKEEGIAVPEVTTSGTLTLPAVLGYRGFKNRSIVHRVSPGTIVYGDMTSMKQLPSHYRYRPAALVLSRVVSHPRAGIVTCDAGHKTLSVDAGVPNCAVVGAIGLRALAPSEEHLPIEVPFASTPPAIGEVLYLVPRHVCPTVNNFDHALFVRNGEIQSVERVSSRGRESPLIEATTMREA